MIAWSENSNNSSNNWGFGGGTAEGYHSYLYDSQRLMKWVGADLNRRHTDFQSVALPTELPTRNWLYRLTANFGNRRYFD
jgi:hypothetical protein